MGEKFAPSWLFSRTYGDIDSKKKIKNQSELKTCNECSASFKTSFNLDRHYMNMHYKKKYECDECLQLFGREDNLKKHIMNAHDAQKIYVGEHLKDYNKGIDDSVDEDNISESAMEKDTDDLEIKKDSGSNSFGWKCDKCNKNFSSKFNLGVHKKKMQKCENCDISFCNKTMLKVHMKFSHGITPFECKICFEKFSTKQNLKRHEQAKKVANCDECGAKFCNSRSVNSHQYKHFREKMDSK